MGRFKGFESEYKKIAVVFKFKGSEDLIKQVNMIWNNIVLDPDIDCPICLENQKWYLPCSYSNQHILSCLECYCDITKNYSPEKRCKLCNINIEILGPKKNYNGIFYAWCGKC